MQYVLGASAVLGLACGATAGDLLHDNSDMVTHPGKGADGADVSMASVDVNTAGSNVNEPTGPYRMADVFWVDGDWEVDRIRVYVYSTGGDPNNPAFTGFNLNLWDGLPADEDSNMVASSSDFTGLEWTGIYRVFNGEGNLGNTERPIMQVDIELDGVELEPGYYWFDWQANHPASAWAPYVMEPNPDDPFDPITVEGTSWQDTPDGWQFTAVGDAGRQISLPVQIYGVSETGKCPEDLTGDGSVGGDDLGTLLSAWGPCDDPDDCPEDLTGDGSVGGDDLGTLLSAWGECPGGGVEPTTPMGACCLPDDSCEFVTEDECDAEGGEFSNDFIPCEFIECAAPECGAPGTGNCCEANGTPFCDDADCCNLICGQDPFCCDTSWDQLCADQANDKCEVCQ